MQEVIEHLQKEGYGIDDIVADGKLRRFRVDPKDDKRSGWYKCFENYRQDNGEKYYFCIYGSWRDGDGKKHFSTLGKVPAAQARLHKEQIDRARKEAEQEREQEYAEAAEEAKAFWETLTETHQESPYLHRKGIVGNSLGIRFDGNGNFYVPILDVDDRLMSLERITAGGTKLGWSGARKSGGFHILRGKDSAGRIYLAEGLATAASIREATECDSVCSFGVGNLKAVAVSLRKKFPERIIVVCGDLDKPGKGDGASKAAREAAKAILCPIVFPELSEEEKAEGLSDFNDLYLRRGVEAVRAQLRGIGALEPIKLNANEVVEIPFPDQDEKGKRLGTVENYRELFRRLNIVCRYNGIKKENELLIPGVATTCDNRMNVNLGWILSWCQRCHLPTQYIETFITVLAEENLYNPVANWIENKPWDGKSRLKDLYATVVAPECEMKELLMRRWLISAIAAAYEPNGVSAHGVLVFQGGQYVGKTHWFKRLAPRELNVLKDGAMLRPEDKDIVYQCISHWIVELGELDATFRRADIAQLKAFIPKDRDILRRPYARAESHFARRTVFFASVNDPEYLNDPTGNRRFWTIGECQKIYHDHDIDMQQLWAEVLTLYRAGEPWRLLPDEFRALNEHNARFEIVEALEERISSEFDWTDPRRSEMTTAEVCRLLGIANPSNRDIRIAARTIKKLSNVPMRRSNNKKLYSIPPVLVSRNEKYSVQD